MEPTIRIQPGPFDIAAETARLATGAGAVATFSGFVRAEPGLTAMRLEHYPGMTEREIARHAYEAAERWALTGVTVVHRIGELKPGDPIVLVAIAAQHRGAAFAACEFLMDHLKTAAPFWKQEQKGAEANWVEAKTSDDAAAARWTIRPPED